MKTSTALRILVLETLVISGAGCMRKEGISFATITPEPKFSTPTVTATATAVRTTIFTDTPKPPEPTATLKPTSTATVESTKVPTPKIEPTNAPAPEVKAVLGTTDNGVNLDTGLANMQDISKFPENKNGMASTPEGNAFPWVFVTLNSPNRLLGPTAWECGISTFDGKPVGITVSELSGSVPVFTTSQIGSFGDIRLSSTGKSLGFEDMGKLKGEKVIVLGVSPDVLKLSLGRYKAEGIVILTTTP